jgi:hypothetical protein
LTGGESWWLTVVYGPTVQNLKPEFLEEPLRDALDGPWAVVGNFNLILDARDKNNSWVNRRLMASFRSCVNDLELGVHPRGATLHVE